MNAPTPVVVPPQAGLTATFIQADFIAISVTDATGLIAAKVIISYYTLASDNVTKIFAYNPNGSKITSTIQIADVAGRAARRAAAGDTVMATWLNDSLALIPDELAKSQAEQAAITAAQAVLTADKAVLTADKAALAPSATLVAGIAAVGVAQTALAAAQAAAVP